jgi:hypothetical protein
MADNIHYSLSVFRDTILNAISRLEFELRDKLIQQPPVATTHSVNSKLEELIRDLSKRI